MSNKDNKADPADGPSEKGKADPRPTTIPVKSLRFRPGFALDMPGIAAAGAIPGEAEPTNKPHHRIHLIPGLRCYRVEWFKHGEKLDRKPEAVRHVPESWASWEPFS